MKRYDPKLSVLDVGIIRTNQSAEQGNRGQTKQGSNQTEQGSNHIFARFCTGLRAFFAAGLTDGTSHTH